MKGYKRPFQTKALAEDSFFPIKEAWANRVIELSDGGIEISIVPVGKVVEHNETLGSDGAGVPKWHITDLLPVSGKDPFCNMLGSLVGTWSAREQMFDNMENGGGNVLFNQLMSPYGLHLLGPSAVECH